ncbi:hypothetical protein PROFUN_11126 [Planoprotostelium fungivorum]|uniref:Uncharacterized protein n=1 Tax=Planoprotostelium fungivorum TaxID=1890364 RepID=A0A2P6NAS0_9EUKA|nr:hypothetical protein PROFUN_11126 [Planoprotostelium fungivorum]
MHHLPSQRSNCSETFFSVVILLWLLSQDFLSVQTIMGGLKHIGDLAQMVEHSLSMRGAQGSIPWFSTHLLNF